MCIDIVTDGDGQLSVDADSQRPHTDCSYGPGRPGGGTSLTVSFGNSHREKKNLPKEKSTPHGILVRSAIIFVCVKSHYNWKKKNGNK